MISMLVSRSNVIEDIMKITIHLLTDDLDHHTLAPATVELGVENLLPGAKIRAPLRDRDDHLMTDDEVPEVRIAVVLTRLVVTIIFFDRSQLLKPLLDVVDEAALGVVNIDAGGDVHGRDQRKALLNAALRDKIFHLIRDVDEVMPFRRLEPEIFGK